MPLYEFRCDRCQHGFEVIEPMPGEQEKECPHCRGRSIRIISVVNHTFGWRLTEQSHHSGDKEDMERAV